MPPELDEALAYLESHVNFELAPSRRAAPTLDRMEALCGLLGDPQRAFPVVHITGTNGKGSTARMVSAVLGAHGLTVGTYTSPHLERINERMAWDGQPIEDDVLAELLLGLEPYEEHLGLRLTHFELLTAAAYRWFADLAVEAAVVEVGMGGRWDATNVADGAVAVVTNVGLDHAEVIGPTLADIATEKSGIIKPGSVVVLGEQSPSLRGIFEARHSAGVWHRGVEFACERNDAAVGGRVIDVRTPSGTLADLYLPLHGPHQGINATVAVTACEAFFGRVLDPSVVTDALAGVAVPGRFEVLRRQPLVVLDGAHNVDGARALTATLDDEFAGRVPDVLVVGFTSGRDPAEMLSILRASLAREVIACTPPHPRGIAAAAVAEAVDFPVGVAPSVPAAVARAMESAGDNDFVLVTGSLYVVGDARTALRR